ncbi:Uncharacterised protein [Serratia quinivorans]|nr:Uncharacterised protein [Serratia quinivorans]CAI0747799.1 Uncharacterised protein [Serratia quinivorans]CAI1508616.1 Uncharacterised protein [Serratia quinivorans]CAI1538680.1 Uncharacterised protein [Serratia quinivorans]CAI1596507.1 Uncharacterised protein [Serratia quinivorans]
MSRQLFVSLDGPKGAGKTTLLEAITKVLRADNKKRWSDFADATMQVISEIYRVLG